MIGPEQITAPDFTEPIVGYRTFRLVRRNQHNYGLVSPHAGTPWPTSEMKAECTVKPKLPEGLVLTAPLKPHPAPAKDCGCGIYAYFDPCPVAKLRSDYYFHGFGDAGKEVEALVTLTGRIEVHETGMRAQRGRVCALGLNANLSNDERAGLTRIGEQWGAPVVPQSQLPALASEYGRGLGKEHRPSLDDEAEALAEDPAFRAGVEAAMEFGPKRYVPAWWMVAANGACAAVNAGLVVAYEKPCNVVAVAFSSVLAGWYAGRRKEAKRS
jgi:hypothetical protein